MELADFTGSDCRLHFYLFRQKTAKEAEDKIGTMLPCNVIVQEIEASIIKVAAVNPMASMQAVENENLNEIANEIIAMREFVLRVPQQQYRLSLV